jgi:NADH-quinone oxidoreductase subunit L
MFMTFYGAPRGDHHAHDHAHESPVVMLIPLGVLSLGAVFAGMIWYGNFFGDIDKMRNWFGMEAAAHGEAAATHGAEAVATEGHATDAAVATTEHAVEAAPAEAASTEHAVEAAPAEATGHAAEAAAVVVATGPIDMTAMVAPKGAIYLAADNHVMHDAHGVPEWVKISPFIAMLLGLALAWKFYIRSPELPAKLAENQRPLYNFLLNKWYFDELYDAIFVKPALWLGRFLWKNGDEKVIDGSLNGVALGIIPFFTKLAGRWQSGYVFTYAFAMVLGIAALLTWMTLTVGH